MRLVPTLGLGPKRLARRPVETLLLTLAVALGTVAAIVSADALASLLADLDRTARDPALRTVRVWDQDRTKRTAVMSEQRLTETLTRLDHPGDYSAWVDRVRDQVPGIEAAFFDYGAAAQVRSLGQTDWVQTDRSFCAQPDLFRLSGVVLLAGRAPTAEEFVRGDRTAVVGQALAATLFPGVGAADVLGREFEVMPRFWEPEVYRIRILGICGRAPGGDPGAEGDPDGWLALTKLPGSQWGTASFVAQTVGQVPAVTARVKALMAQDPQVKPLAVDDRYPLFEEKRILSFFAAFLALVLGAGSLAVALWTLGSVFRARVPSMQKSLRTLRALGADQGVLTGLGLSEVLPPALGGLILGLGLAAGLRGLVLGGTVFRPQDPWLLGFLLVLTAGLPLVQVTLPPARNPRPFLRFLLAGAFLTVGLAGSFMALSLAGDIGRTLPRLQPPLPFWAGPVQAGGNGEYFTDGATSLTPGDLAAVGALVPPADWTPVRIDQSMISDVTVRIPSQDNRRVWIRTKALARPSLVGILGMEVTAGRLPTGAEAESRPRALVSEEVAETLFGSASGALGQILWDDEGPFVQADGAYEIVGVLANPTTHQEGLGWPDVLLVPDARIWGSLTAKPTGLLLVFHPRRVQPSVLEDRVVPALRASHPAPASVYWWKGGQTQALDDRWADGIQEGARTSLTVIVVLSALFLVVSCLSVLSAMFVQVTSRSRAIAVERALGRPFGHFARRCFVQGALLVLGAAAAGIPAALAALPALTRSLQSTLGDLFSRSTGQVDLGWGTTLAVTAAAAALAGLVAVLPLLPYRRIPIAVQIKEES